ncbi:MAG: c-type cytochrome biogenesis protein CcmI [Gammaproteobacteria bacterium]|jgi:cytochrome c-type biogenesis protein CcmH|nr:c-type cytochrome biogenesis protein CcmI [Gammaproteobacteria bacterium]
MTLFWMITAGMILATLALLAPTLLRKLPARSDTTEQLNVAIARERLAELVKQRDASELSDEEFAQARRDLELALAEDLGETATAEPARTEPQGRPQARWALPASALVILAITVPVYVQIGNPGLIDPSSSDTQVAEGHSGSGETPPIDELVEQLRARLEAKPSDVEDWYLLGRTYMSLRQYADAVYAFEHAVELAPNELSALLPLVDALVRRDNGQLSARTVELLERVRSINPDSITALWLLGKAAADNGDLSQALAHWQRAYPLLGEQPEMQKELAGLIRRAGGEPPETVDDLPSIMATAPVAARSAPPTTGAAPAAAAEDAAIVVEVALTPALMEQVTETDTVFVLARAESGPSMPLAVARHQAGELPLRITLTDAMAMMPALKLSSFDRVTISAKVSKSGQPRTQPGDMLAGDRLVETGNPPGSVQLVIDRVVE